MSVCIYVCMHAYVYMRTDMYMHTYMYTYPSFRSSEQRCDSHPISRTDDGQAHAFMHTLQSSVHTQTVQKCIHTHTHTHTHTIHGFFLAHDSHASSQVMGMMGGPKTMDALGGKETAMPNFSAGMLVLHIHSVPILLVCRCWWFSLMTSIHT